MWNRIAFSLVNAKRKTLLKEKNFDSQWIHLAKNYHFHSSQGRELLENMSLNSLCFPWESKGIFCMFPIVSQMVEQNSIILMGQPSSHIHSLLKWILLKTLSISSCCRVLIVIKVFIRPRRARVASSSFNGLTIEPAVNVNVQESRIPGIIIIIGEWMRNKGSSTGKENLKLFLFKPFCIELFLSNTFFLPRFFSTFYCFAREKCRTNKQRWRRQTLVKIE